MICRNCLLITEMLMAIKDAKKNKDKRNDSLDREETEETSSSAVRDDSGVVSTVLAKPLVSSSSTIINENQRNAEESSSTGTPMDKKSNEQAETGK